jgi:hypothetical protein
MPPMTLYNLGRAALLAALAVLPAREGVAAKADNPYGLKVQAGVAPPKEVAEPVRQVLTDRCIQFTDAKGAVLAELWFRKELPAKATEAQVKNGLTYREFPETTLFGVLRVVQPMTDYRKQKVPAGVYTLRLAYQPMDGDHMGTAPFSEFLLVSPAAEDKKPDLMEVKALHEASAKATGNHPGVFLLFPGKDAGEPKLVNKGDGHWVVLVKVDAAAGGLKASIGVGLTLVGVSPSAE